MPTRKQNILGAATLLFSQQGINETAMSEIAKASGVAEGTIFYHFKTKEALFLSTLENVRKGITEEFRNFTANKSFENGMDMLENTLYFFLYLAGTREEWFLLLHRHHPYELARINPVCREHLESIYNCLADIFEAAINEGVKDGSILTTNARKTALIVFSLINGLVWFKVHNLYDAGALYSELIDLCRRMLKPNIE